MNFTQLEELVLEWADKKDLLHEGNVDKQFMKFIEEVFEFKTELDAYIYIKNDLDAEYDVMGEIFSDKHFYTTFDNLKLEMGDIFVTLIILCKQLGITPAECLELAYNKISKRKGKTINGIFVKEEDLKDVEE